MADTFFEFDISLNNGDNLLPPDEDECLENEEEYDALNDETFGGLVDSAELDDWEQQHEQFAEVAENSKHLEKLENTISHLALDEPDEPVSLSNSVWSYTPPTKNGDISNSSILSSLQRASKAFIETYTDLNGAKSANSNSNNKTLVTPLIPTQPKKICTVEELEKNLLKSSKQQQNALPPQSHQLSATRPPLLPPPPSHPHLPGNFPMHPLLQQQQQQQHRPPPGLPPLNVPPPGMRMPPHHHHHHPHHVTHPMLPPGMLRMLPPPNQHPQFPNGLPRPPGFAYPVGTGPPNQFPVNHPFNYAGGPPVGGRGMPHPPPNNQQQHMHQQNLMGQRQQHGGGHHHHHLQHSNSNFPLQHMQQVHNQHHQQQQQQQRTRHDSSGGGYGRQQHQHKDGHHQHAQEPRDEYAGLMSTREKQWLLNIQLLQLNTGTPYFDDYYYTIFKERKSKNNKENDKNTYHSNNKRQHRNSDRQENQNTLTPRVYTPQQFENSLGKLQCGSVTAPRKIIDVEIVMCDKDGDTVHASRDTRKTKQLLLELEALYALLLKAEDINNTLYISNMEKLREIKQKQRLRELELAPTPEQKQEILKLFKKESEPIVENQNDYLVKIMQGLLHDDKFSSFMNIRKGKMLVLRILPYLSKDVFSTHLLELWSKILLSLPVSGRRDAAGDNIFPKLYPFFKRYIQSSTMSDILDMISGLVEVVKQENSRSTPLSHVGKQPLYFVVSNVFGLSALIMLLVRTEYLISSDAVSEKQQSDWSNFLLNWAQQLEPPRRGMPEPLELIPFDILNKHLNRFDGVIKDKRSLLEPHVVDPYS